MIRRVSLTGLVVAALGMAVVPAVADNTITGVVTNCSSVPVPGVLVYIAAIATSATCSSSSARVACRVTNANGVYSYSSSPDPNDVKYCIWTDPLGDGWGGCNSCSASKCCGGSAPVYAQGGTTTILANSNNGTYTVSFGLTYSGACNTSDGQVSGLTGLACHSYSIDLQWTAPSDSGCAVIAYDVRYSTSAIDEGNWGSATILYGEPTPAKPGATESFTATLPYPCTLYYFGIKAQRRDESYSPLSTTCAGTLCEGSSECGICD